MKTEKPKQLCSKKDSKAIEDLVAKLRELKRQKVVSFCVMTLNCENPDADDPDLRVSLEYKAHPGLSIKFLECMEKAIPGLKEHFRKMQP